MAKTTRKRQWSDGVYLLGQYDWFKTGCWLLTHGNEGAILEMPPYNPAYQESPAEKAARVAKQMKLRIKYILCSHHHVDHFSLKTGIEMQQRFPDAEVQLQRGFEGLVQGRLRNTFYFDHESTLNLGGEALYLVHAPKHSSTDTPVIFKGVAIMGDWELNMLRSTHDNKPRHRVDTNTKLHSIWKMRNFQHTRNYHIHKVFSVHANDRRDNVNFDRLMDETARNR